MLRTVVLVVLIAILIILIIAALTGYRCFLDILNATIQNQCVFQPFYAGTDTTPPTRGIIPALGQLEDAFSDIKREMQAILSAQIPEMHSVYDNIFMGGSGRVMRAVSSLIYGADTEIFDNIGSSKWQTFNLIMFGHDVPKNAARCPITISLLRQIPGMQSALFSIIAPGAYIPPHNDPAKGVIRYHLALQVPQDREYCFICVNGQKYHWTEGEGVLFDDVYDHWVVNDTDEYRVILFVDILRPLTGIAKNLQSFANFANYYHPGVRRAINASIVSG